MRQRVRTGACERGKQRVGERARQWERGWTRREGGRDGQGIHGPRPRRAAAAQRDEKKKGGGRGGGGLRGRRGRSLTRVWSAPQRTRSGPILRSRAQSRGLYSSWARARARARAHCCECARALLRVHCFACVREYRAWRALSARASARAPAAREQQRGACVPAPPDTCCARKPKDAEAIPAPGRPDAPGPSDGRDSDGLQHPGGGGGGGGAP